MTTKESKTEAPGGDTIAVPIRFIWHVLSLSARDLSDKARQSASAVMRFHTVSDADRVELLAQSTAYMDQCVKLTKALGDFHGTMPVDAFKSIDPADFATWLAGLTTPATSV